MEFENKYASNAKGNLGVTLGGIALGASLLGGNGLNLFGNNACNGCGENTMVNRYELTQNARISELETEVKLRDSNIYTDSKILDLYKYVDSKFANVDSAICQQAVVNAQITANISCMQNAINTLNGLTKTIIPITNVCPEPMPQYNSWTAPTAGA